MARFRIQGPGVAIEILVRPETGGGVDEDRDDHAAPRPRPGGGAPRPAARAWAGVPGAPMGRPPATTGPGRRGRAAAARSARGGGELRPVAHGRPPSTFRAGVSASAGRRMPAAEGARGPRSSRAMAHVRGDRGAPARRPARAPPRQRRELPAAEVPAGRGTRRGARSRPLQRGPRGAANRGRVPAGHRAGQAGVAEAQRVCRGRRRAAGASKPGGLGHPGPS